MTVLLLVKVTVLFAVAFAASVAMRRFAVVRRTVWTAAFTSALALPFLVAAVPPLRVAIPGLWRASSVASPTPSADAVHGDDAPSPSSMPDGQIGIDVAPGADSAVPARGGRVSAAPRQPLASWLTRLSVSDWFTIAWLVGVVIATGALLVSLWRVRRLARSAVRVIDPAWQQAAAEMSARLGSRTPRLLMSPAISTPMAGHVPRPTVFVPASATAWTPDTRDVVLTHEIAHLTARDPLRYLLVRIVSAIYWCHPLVWVAAIASRRACEEACDETVLAIGVRPSTYARVLLDLADAQRGASGSAGVLPAVTRSRLERRIARILTAGRHSARRGLRGMSAAGLMFVSLSVAAVSPIPATTRSAVAAPPTIDAARVPDVPLEPAALAANPGAAPRPQNAPLPIVTPPSAPRTTLRIHVVDGTTGMGLEGASLALRCSPDFSLDPRADTDARGDGVVNLPGPAQCMVYGVTKNGYSQNLDEQARRSDVPAGTETLRTLRLWRSAAISGHVLDEGGAPIPNVEVFRRAGDRLGTTLLQRGTGPAVTTDAEGGFQFLSVRTPDYDELSVPSVQVVNPLGPFRLEPGDSRVVEIRGHLLPVFRVAGQLSATDRSVLNLAVHLDRGDSPEEFPFTVADAHSDDSGRFVFPAVPQGTYRLRVDTGSGPFAPDLSPAMLWAVVPLAVDRDLDAISLPLQAGARVRGTVVLDGPTTGSVLLGLDGASGRMMGHFMLHVNGTFGGEVLPGRYAFRATGVPSGFQVSHVTLNGRDVTAEGVDLAAGAIANVTVTLTDKAAQLTGVVRDAQGREDGEATVVVFGTDDRIWTSSTLVSYQRVRLAMTTQHGAYALRLPFGDYYIAAVPSPQLPESAVGIPSTLLARLAASAARVRIDASDQLTRDLDADDVGTVTLRRLNQEAGPPLAAVLSSRGHPP